MRSVHVEFIVFSYSFLQFRHWWPSFVVQSWVLLDRSRNFVLLLSRKSPCFLNTVDVSLAIPVWTLTTYDWDHTAPELASKMNQAPKLSKPEATNYVSPPLIMLLVRTLIRRPSLPISDAHAAVLPGQGAPLPKSGR